MVDSSSVVLEQLHTSRPVGVRLNVAGHIGVEHNVFGVIDVVGLPLGNSSVALKVVAVGVEIVEEGSPAAGNELGQIGVVLSTVLEGLAGDRLVVAGAEQVVENESDLLKVRRRGGAVGNGVEAEAIGGQAMLSPPLAGEAAVANEVGVAVVSSAAARNQAAGSQEYPSTGMSG